MSQSSFWHRCMKCGYMYTPQQFLALAELRVSQSGEKLDDLLGAPERVPCRNHGCAGRLARTESQYREAL